MSNELEKTSATETELSNLINPTESDAKALANIGVSNFIPTLSIGYGTSDAVKLRIAQLGDFVLGGKTTLGTTIKAIILNYRLHAQVYDKDKNSFEGDCYHLRSNPLDVEQDLIYQAFLKANYGKDCVVNTGVDFFIYLPEHTSFCTFFLKATLANYVKPVWSAGANGRLIELKTEFVKGKRHDWYGLVTNPLSRALNVSNLSDVTKDIIMPMDQYKKFSDIFNNPTTGPEVVETPDRQR